jgi:probable HAF family extracellular repeat protein
MLRHLQILLLFCLLGRTAISQTTYEVIDLGSLGGSLSIATGINNLSQVVGQSQLSGNNMHAFFWENGQMTDLGTLGGSASAANGINNSSQVVGGAFFPDNTTGHACLWENGQITDLGTLGGLGSNAFAINNLSQVVGAANTEFSGHAFLWENGQMTDLGTLGGSLSIAYGINNSSQVIGFSDLGGNISHAFIWENGQMTDLVGTLGGYVSCAYGINNLSQVVGVANNHAFLWENGQLTDLGTLGGGTSVAYAINNLNQVVGYSYLSVNTKHAFLWENGLMKDLNSLIDPGSGWTLISAVGINDNGEIIGNGLNNGQNRAFILKTNKLQISRPLAGELWISGEPDTIKWTGGQVGQLLQLEYSADSNLTFNSIASNFPADNGFYIWNKPDSILSAKCGIRIFDMSDTTIVDTSDIFKMKGYVLTRIKPDGNYEPYSIIYDAWGFANKASDVWPASWFSRFNYQGIDPFTGSQYSQWQGNFVFATSLSSEHPDWSSFVNTFGASACYLSTNLGVYSPTALSYWESIKNPWNGSCFGIAISNFLAWENDSTFHNKYPNFPTFINPITVLSNTNVIPVINELFTHQFGNPHRSYRSNVALNKTPTQTLNDLKQMFITEGAQVQTLSFLHNNGTGGHAILSYKVEKDTLNSNIFYAYVYDNSYPDSNNARIVFNTSANGGNGSWSYSNWPGWGGNKWIYLRDAASNYLTNPTIQKPTERQSPFIIDGGMLQIYESINNSVIIEDNNGNKTGYYNGNINTDIPNSSPFVVDNGSETPPYGYELPSDNYSIVLGNFTKDTTNTFFFTGNKTFAYKRFSATQFQSDRLFFDGGVSVVNPDQQSKTVNLVNIINETTQEKLFAIRSLGLEQNDSVKIENPDYEKLKLISYGSAKNYDIELNFVSENQLGRFGEFDIPLPANTSHTFVPDWTDLTASQLLVLVDFGNNGTIDDTLYFNNTVGVEDEGNLLTPREYNLAQNYPNPFNPTTTIRFSIPQRSNVTLKVYDILGNDVTSLVNEEKERGFYTVNFDASQLASGIYLYRIQAGSFVETKKMIVLK